MIFNNMVFNSILKQFFKYGIGISVVVVSIMGIESYVKSLTLELPPKIEEYLSIEDDDNSESVDDKYIVDNKSEEKSEEESEEESDKESEEKSEEESDKESEKDSNLNDDSLEAKSNLENDSNSKNNFSCKLNKNRTILNEFIFNKNKLENIPEGHEIVF